MRPGGPSPMSPAPNPSVEPIVADNHDATSRCAPSCFHAPVATTCRVASAFPGR